MSLSPDTAIRLETFAARLVMLVMAAGIAYTGYALITRPLAIPLAVVLWLGAAAIFCLGLWGPLPQGEPEAGHFVAGAPRTHP
jgi:hypothetical protein